LQNGDDYTLTKFINCPCWRDPTTRATPTSIRPEIEAETSGLREESLQAPEFVDCWHCSKVFLGAWWRASCFVWYDWELV